MIEKSEVQIVQQKKIIVKEERIAKEESVKAEIEEKVVKMAEKKMQLAIEEK